jgi:cation-transporting P-type ATPase C
VLGGAKLLLIFSSRLVAATGALSVITITITGYDFLRALWRTVTGRTAITTGTLIGAATLSSVILRENVTALIVLWLLNLGEYLETVTLRRTDRAIRQFLATDEEEVWVEIDGVERNFRLKDVEVGAIVCVRAGRKIPADGVVESGEATVNEAAITGESVPALKTPGDPVYAGTVLMAGTIRVRVTGVGSSTVVGRLIERVEQAQSLRPRIQTTGDAFARRVVPASFAAAVMVFFITRDARRALTMMLIACPCAAGLATPTAVSATIGNSARRGILIKGGTYVEALAEVDAMCFDKTGTLTETTPAVQHVLSLAAGYDDLRVQELAARAEAHSQHPLAIAIVQHTGRPASEITRDDEYEILAGLGVRVWQGDEEIIAGSSRMMSEYKISMAHIVPDVIPPSESAVFVAHRGQIVGVIGLSTSVRPEAREVMHRLREMGIRRLVMLTGDRETVAARTADIADIPEYRFRLLPQEKFDFIQEMRSQSHCMAMVGDGINDAPALAIADVGLAMGTGRSDVAIETADVVLAADDLRHIVWLVKASRRTMDVIRENYSIALSVNAGGLCLAALGRINPVIAAVLHNLSTILVVANSARLIRYDSME